MNDNIKTHSNTEHIDTDHLDTENDGIGRLLRAAGPRPAVPEWDTAVVKAAAKKRWRLKVAELQGTQPEVKNPGLWGSDHAPRRKRRSLGYWGGGALAAVAVVVLMVGGMMSRPVTATLEGFSGSVAVRSLLLPPGLIRSGDSIKKGDVVEVMANSRAAFRASGGASVRLDTGSRLRWVSSTVLELEQGTAYVDSGPGAAAIEIRTSLGVVREIGTQFEVRVRTMDDGNSNLRVRVREGLVDLEQDGGLASATTLRVGAGEELAMRTDGTVTRGVVAVHGSDWDWTRAAAPVFVSDQRKLGELLAWATREGGWRLEYADPAAEEAASEAELTGYGSIEGSTLREGFEWWCSAANLTCRLEDDRLVVMSSSASEGTI